MSSNYQTLSHTPNKKLDPDTGELLPVVKDARLGVGNKVLGTLTKLNDSVNYIARQTTGKIGEKIVKDILIKHLDKVLKSEGFLFDMRFLDGGIGEVKTGRAGNRTIIIESQLDKMPQKGYYCLVYYKIDGFENPTSCIQYAIDNLKISPEIYLKRKLRIHSIYIFPRSDLVFYFNKPSIRKFPIVDNKFGQETEYYVGVGMKRAHNLFLENPGGFNQTQFSFLGEKGSIPVFVTGFPDIEL